MRVWSSIFLVVGVLVIVGEAFFQKMGVLMIVGRTFFLESRDIIFGW